MSLPERGKLVRDRVPDIVRATGGHPEVFKVTAADMLPALQSKMAEEFSELVQAAPRDRLAELTDVYEVIRATANCLGVDMADVAAAADTKRRGRGGFTGGTWLLSS